MPYSGRLAPAAIALSVALAAPALAADYKEAWRVGGFASPESVSFDPATAALYVTNINGQGIENKGKGYVSKLGLDGRVIAERWAEGLNSPKGTAIAEGRLFVGGTEELAEIDLATGEVVNRYAAPGATFLNDVAIAEDGRVFVTETAEGAVYLLAGGRLEEWVRDPALAGANGLVIADGRLLVACLGDISGGFQNVKPSNVKAIDLDTKTITDFGTAAPVGVLDGIELLADGSVIVTDNPKGRILRIPPGGPAEDVLVVAPGAADLEYVPLQNMLVVPLLGDSTVVAYRG